MVQVHANNFMTYRSILALARLKAFLPAMKEANEKLVKDMKNQPRENFDIESVKEGEAHIEMVLSIN